jgi:hypothetical protein
VIATIIVVLVGGGRWLLGRQLISGQSPLSAGRPAPGKPRPAPRDRRPGTDSWADDNPLDNPAARTSPTGPTPRQGTGPRPGNPPAGARPPRPPRDPRGTRDPWGDPRLPADRTQPPTGNPRPRPSGQSQPQPRAPRPSWSPSPNQNPAPQRPPRRQPPEGWTQRLRRAPVRGLMPSPCGGFHEISGISGAPAPDIPERARQRGSCQGDFRRWWIAEPAIARAAIHHLPERPAAAPRTSPRGQRARAIQGLKHATRAIPAPRDTQRQASAATRLTKRQERRQRHGLPR